MILAIVIIVLMFVAVGWAAKVQRRRVGGTRPEDLPEHDTGFRY
jgi:hypothetical protein